MKIRVVLMGLVLTWIGTGCFSMHNVEVQQRLHHAQHRQANPIKASIMNDGSPAIGYDLSMGDAITTNIFASVTAGVADAVVAGAAIWGGVKLLPKDGGSDKKSSTASTKTTKTRPDVFMNGNGNTLQVPASVVDNGNGIVLMGQGNTLEIRDPVATTIP